MGLVGWLWLGSPFVLIAVISRDSDMRGLIAAHHRRCRAIGWFGAAAMFLGAALLPGTFGSMLFGVGTPLVGLIVWTPRDDGAGGGEGGPDEVPPDWDGFERSFWAHVRRRDQPPSRPRARASR